MAITYYEMNGSPVETITQNSVRAKRVLRCAYADRITLQKELLGYSATVGEVTTQYPPNQYDPAGDSSYPLGNIYAREVSISPHGSRTPTGYDQAILEVSYSDNSFENDTPGTVNYITESIEPVSEFITLPNDKLYWDNAQEEPLSNSSAPGMIIRMIDWVYTINKVETLPSWIWTLPGCTNSASVTSSLLGKSFDAETLLCGNPRMSRQISNEGDNLWTVEIRFTYKPTGWNNFPNPDSIDGSGNMQMSPIYNTDGDAIKIYTLASFSSI